MYRTLIERGGWLLILLFAGVAAALAVHLRRFTIDAGTNVLLDQTDPDLAYYNRTRADWDYDEYTIVCVHREDWFTPESIQVLNDFTSALEKLDYVKKVTAINTLPLLRYRKISFSQLLSGKLDFPDLRQKGVDPAKARDEILHHTQAQGNLISKDGKDLSVLVYLTVSPEIMRLEPLWSKLHGSPDDPEARREIEKIRGPYEEALKELRLQRKAQVHAIRRLTREWEPKFGEPVRLSGLTIINVNLVEHIISDLGYFGAAAAIVFVLAFFAVYRRVRWVLLPILTCLLPVVMILGYMSWTGRKMTVITSNLPVLLFILILPYTVYFVERYLERRAIDPGEDVVTTVTGSCRDIWRPCFYSATTTMAGFGSLVTSGMIPVKTFGLMMAIGMGVGLAGVMLFLPAMVRPLAGLPGRAGGIAREPRGPLRWLAAAATRAPLAVVGFSLAILGVSIWGTTKLTAETKFIDYFWSKSEVYAGLEYIDTRMGGTTPLEIYLRSDTPGHFKTAEGLAEIAAAQKFFDDVPETGNVRSFRTLVDEVKLMMPSAKDGMILGFLAPKEGWKEGDIRRDLVREFCSDDFTVSRVLVRMKETAPTLNRKRILDDLRAYLEKEPALAGLKEKRPTGVFVLYSNMLQSLIKSQKDTFLMVVGAIFVMLVILFRSPLLALIVLVPQVLPVFVVLGVMGFAGIALDMVTTMIASVAMGVGIDAAIQYTVRFRRELPDAPDRIEAVRRTHATIGQAIGFATLIVFAGFIVLVLSKFVPTVYFGIFTGLAMLMGLFASLTTLPAVFVLLKYPRK